MVRHDPAQDLIVVRGAEDIGYLTAAFRAQLPGPRVWCRVGLLFTPLTTDESPDGMTPPEGEGDIPGYWLAATEGPQNTGPGGESGRQVPVLNLVGTSAAPLAIPVDSDLFGYTSDIRGGYIGVRGRLRLLNPETQGAWRVFASWWAMEGVCRKEWEELAASCRLTLETGGAVEGPSGE